MLQRRYVHGPGTDEPIVWYEGSDRRWLHADERGSIVAVSNGSGSMTAINSYDEYGTPATGNAGRFGYTGQTWISDLNLWHYKARFYSPRLGRFMQTDPIGYAAGMNLYAYVGNDPVNFIDPTGLDIVVLGQTCGSGFIMVGEGDGPNYCVRNLSGILDDFYSRIGGGSGSSGGGGGFTPRPRPPLVEQTPEDIFDCDDALLEGGAIEIVGFGGDAVIGIGLVGATGTFRNVATGTSGRFVTTGFGAGAGFGIGGIVGIYESLSDFKGYSDNVQGSANIGPYSIGGFQSKSLAGRVIGSGATAAYEEKPGGLKASFVGSFTETSIFGCKRK